MMVPVRKWMLLILTPLWRWKWLFLVCLTITASYGAMAQGRTRPAVIFKGSNSQNRRICHGWPCEYLIRRVPNSDIHGRWLILKYVEKFTPSKFACNLAVAIGISLLLTYVVAWRFSSSLGWRQFGLKEVLGLTVAVALVLGVVRHAEVTYQADKEYLADLEKSGWRLSPTEGKVWYLLPLRDLRLIRDEAAIRHCLSLWAPDKQTFRLPTAESNAVQLDVNQLLILQADSGRRLHYHLESLQIKHPGLNEQGIDALLRWAPECESLFISSDRCSAAAVDKIAEVRPTLKRLHLNSPELTGDAIASLGKLKHLERMYITKCNPEVSADGVRFVDQLPRLKVLVMPSQIRAQLPNATMNKLEERGIEIYEASSEF